MAKKIVFANQKGGVGKTTTAVNLGAYIAALGKRVLLIDFDPQSNSSSNLGVKKDNPNVYHVIMRGEPIKNTIRKTEIENFYIVPSTIDLAGATVELVELEGREFFLRRAIEDIEGEFDFIFIDCPPSLGLLTINGLVASDYVIIPLQCEYFALEGLSLLLDTIGRVKEQLNPRIDIAGILFTMYDTRTRLAHEVVQEVVSYFKNRVFRTIIPRNVRLSEAPSFGKPIMLYDPECIGAKSYKKLAEEVISYV